MRLVMQCARGLTISVIVALAVTGSRHGTHLAEATAPDDLRVTLGPHETPVIQSRPDRVLLYLTADLDGHLPSAEAVWEPAGSGAPKNAAGTVFEAVVVELKTPIETITFAPEWLADEGDRTVVVTPLIDNSRVTVTKCRMMPVVNSTPRHAHSKDTIVFYVTGGQMAGTTAQGSLYGRHARRGEIDVLRPDTEHALGNLGGDPIELVLIQPK